MDAPSFDFESGELCLDFANTSDWHASEHPQERLRSYADLLAWGEAAGILSADQATRLRQMALQQPEVATVAHRRAIELREAIYRIFSNHYRRGAIDPADLQTLNAFLTEALPHLRLVQDRDGFTWSWEAEADALDRVLWQVARSAAELLTSATLERVRECEDDRGCGYLFVDTTRNRSRRWCSMESCGNRAKQRRHYARLHKPELTGVSD